MTNELKDRTAIVYGAAGRLGRGVSLGFARAGATVVLAGRRRAPLDALAAEIAAGGGTAYAEVADALDDAAVTALTDRVRKRTGRLDVSFNLVSRGDVQGTPLLDMDVEDYMRPILAGARSDFLTARAAGRHMAEQGAGVILIVSSGSGAVLKPSPSFNMGGTGPADAASESFLHYLAAELGPRGVRVVGLWTAGVPYPEQMARLSMLGRGPTLEQLADAAVFVASDRGSGITGSILNVSSGVSGS